VGTKPWSSTAPPGEFRPYVGAEDSVREFSLRAVVLGALFGILFGAVSVYVGLRAGLTVSASIPIAVLSISILRAFGRSTILENNIVQTTGSAGESAAAGVIFTMPALIFLGFSLNTEYWRVFFLALLGGTLGVSRVVTSQGWRPHRQQVGQTGTRISPELYLACGISGAIQHMAGCQSARHIVAVNTDPDAPIISRADYAVIGDLNQVIPALVAALRERAARA